MKINADFDINMPSVEEFARVMVPEALNDEIDIASFIDDKTIKISGVIKKNNKKSTFEYENKNGKIDDQRLTTVKMLILVLYEKKYSWGGLMGVRPTKIVRRLLSYNCTIKEIKDILRDFYLVTDDKIQLLIDVVEKELKIMDNNYINIYIGIPFCPTKCTYCSFASYEITGGVGKYYNSFVRTLVSEIVVAGEFLKKEGYKVQSIYIGGGTPSILEPSDMDEILKAVVTNIDMAYLKEFTFEAGREDTLTEEKINIMKKYKIDRISLNPQTFNQSTLEKINRKFDREHFDKMYKICREKQFIINMDLIIGLIDETTEDTLNTLEQLKKYDIDNLTIHALAYKRASNLFKMEKHRTTLDKDKIYDKIKEILKEKELFPYYLYRQKNIVEWGENVGYSKNGYESIFNIEMIEENQITFGLGGGAMTKIIYKDVSGRDVIERIVNPKDPALYIKEMHFRTDEKINRLKGVKNGR